MIIRTIIEWPSSNDHHKNANHKNANHKEPTCRSGCCCPSPYYWTGWSRLKCWTSYHSVARCRWSCREVGAVRKGWDQLEGGSKVKPGWLETFQWKAFQPFQRRTTSQATIWNLQNTKHVVTMIWLLGFDLFDEARTAVRASERL